MDIAHHKLITVVLILVVLITGISFGVKIDAAGQGGNGLAIISFALCFLAIILLFLNYTILIHLREEVRAIQTKGKK